MTYFDVLLDLHRNSAGILAFTLLRRTTPLPLLPLSSFSFFSSPDNNNVFSSFSVESSIDIDSTGVEIEEGGGNVVDVDGVYEVEGIEETGGIGVGISFREH